MEDKAKVTGQWVAEDNMFSGKWINRITGEKITINNSLIDNNEMILITSIGQLTMDELSKNYVQDIDGENEIITPDNQPNLNNYEEKYLLPEDQDILNQKVSSRKPIVTNTIQVETKLSKNQNVLDKFFNHNTVKFDIDIDFDCNYDELKTLMKYVDLNVDDICEYVYENIFNKDTIKNAIDKLITNKLNS